MSNDTTVYRIKWVIWDWRGTAWATVMDGGRERKAIVLNPPPETPGLQWFPSPEEARKLKLEFKT